MLLLGLLFAVVILALIRRRRCPRPELFASADLGKPCKGSCDRTQCDTQCCYNGQCADAFVCFGRDTPTDGQCGSQKMQADFQKVGQQGTDCSQSCDASQCASLCCFKGKCQPPETCWGPNRSARDACGWPAVPTTTTSSPVTTTANRPGPPVVIGKTEGQQCTPHSNECVPGLSCQWQGGKGDAVDKGNLVDFGKNILYEKINRGPHRTDYTCARKKGAGEKCVYHEECQDDLACTGVDFASWTGIIGGSGMMYMCLEKLKK